MSGDCPPCMAALASNGLPEMAESIRRLVPPDPERDARVSDLRLRTDYPRVGSISRWMCPGSEPLTGHGGRPVYDRRDIDPCSDLGDEL